MTLSYKNMLNLHWIQFPFPTEYSPVNVRVPLMSDFQASVNPHSREGGATQAVAIRRG